MPEQQHTPPRGRKSVWQATPTANLVRYAPKGTYYVRAWLRGRFVRKSLKTTHYKAAVGLLPDKLRELRGAIGAPASELPETLNAAMALVKSAIANDPSLKSATRASYLEQLVCLDPGRPAALPPTALPRLSQAEMAAWWKKTADTYAPQRANHLLMFIRRAIRMARKAGALFSDPAEDLKRIKIPRTRLNLLTAPQFRKLIAHIRAQRKVRNRESADWIEFMTYCGLRPAEVASLLWEHLDENAGFILVYGAEEGTKNREPRRVPMIEAMRDLIARMRDGRNCVGRVFTVRKPHDALANACRRLGFPHQRIYDLRHTFATMCNAAGVDVPTFAKWLGHKDGGTLAMRTYVHPDEEHSQRSAKKVKF